MQFVPVEEAIGLRAESLYRDSLKLFEQGAYQSAYLLACDIINQCPGRMEGNLMLGRICAKKAKILSETMFYNESRQHYEAVLKLDPANEEARKRLEDIARLGIGDADVPAWADRDLGTEPVSFKDCQIGYHPDGTKSVVVWTLRDYASGSFSVVDRVTGRVELVGELAQCGCYAWKRWHWAAEFSRLKRTGEYVLQVEFKEGPSAESHAFRIFPGVYDKALRLSLDGYFNHRCGQDLAYRKGCNDGPVRFDFDLLGGWAGGGYWRNMENKLKELPQPIAIHGGWHDGGNWERVACNMITNLYCLLLGHVYAPRDWHRYGEAAPDILVEARYGADFFLSSYEAFGSCQTDTWLAVLEKADDGRYFIKKNIQHIFRWEPGIVNVIDVSMATTPKRATWIPWYGRLYGPSLALFSALFRGYDKPLADKCRDIAIKLQSFYREPDPGEKITQSVAAAVALGDIYLWQLTGESAYRDQAEQGIETILAIQEPDGFFPAEGIEHSALCLAGFYPQIAMFEFARVFPDHPLARRVVESVKAFMPWIERLTSVSPFGQMMEYGKESRQNCFTGINGHGPNAYYGYTAIVCLLANRLFKSDTFTATAERQVEWIFGRNPRSVCMMGDAGWRNGSQHQMDVLSNGREFK